MTASATLKATTDITGELRLSLRFATDSETRAAVVKRAGCPPLSVAANPKSTVKRGHEEFVTPGYGFQPSVTVFTKLARQTIKEAAAVIERDYGKRALFITGTLPGGTGAALASIANWSAYIVERVGQWLRDNIAPHELVLVWERQSRGALHLHACLGCFDVASLRFVEIRWRAFWTRLLETVSDKSGLDLFGRAVGGSWRGVYSKVRANACPVRHSVRRYLSKYMSKNRISRNNWRADRAGRQVFFPTRWWGITASLRRKVKECRIVNESLPIPLPVATDLWQQCVGLLSDGQRKLFVYKNHYRPGDYTVVAFHDGADTYALWALISPVLDMHLISPKVGLTSAPVKRPPVKVESIYKNAGSIESRVYRLGTLRSPVEPWSQDKSELWESFYARSAARRQRAG